MTANCVECRNNIRITKETGLGLLYVKCTEFGKKQVPPVCGKFVRRDKIKILPCPNCKAYMVKRKKDYFECTVCGGEWWPPEKDDTADKLAKAAREAFEDIRVGYVPNQSKGGGSKSKRYGKKKVVKSFDGRYREA